MNDQTARPLYAGIEAGGTKFNCVIAYSPDEVLVRQKIPTTTPDETFKQVFAFFADQEKDLGSIAAFGIASFGPIDLHKNSDHYGYITATPKPYWSHTDVVGAFQKFRNIPVAFDTDVNGAALGEQKYGAAKNIDNFVYVTVGTGIGAGVFSGGKMVNGATHPEIGHMIVPTPKSLTSDSDFIASLNNEGSNLEPLSSSESLCPFHQNCLTAFAAGPALEKLWQQPGHKLHQQHCAWDYEAHYLALMCMNLSLFYSPEMIILGGGVMDQQHLFPNVRQRYEKLMGGYMLPQTALEDFIVPPGQPGHSGEIGALVIAEQAYRDNSR